MTETCGPPFWGKYRGCVEDSVDLMGLGRVEVSVPDVLGDGTGWAMPCFPGAGPGVGLFSIPPKGALVWVEFERGNPDFPVYVGGFWKTGDTPVPLGPTQSTTQAWVGKNVRLEWADGEGQGALEMRIKTASGDAILAADGSALGLEFAGNSVSLDASGVTINDGNLKVLK